MTNGEKYKTAQERAEAFTKRYSHTADYNLGVRDFSRWLDLEAEEESFEDLVKEIRERMIDREHSPSLWPFIDRLVAAHNRVARKSEEVKEC